MAKTERGVHRRVTNLAFNPKTGFL
ncbi:unnamed protein product [Victoria cruziana]